MSKMFRREHMNSCTESIHRSHWPVHSQVSMIISRKIPRYLLSDKIQQLGIVREFIRWGWVSQEQKSPKATVFTSAISFCQNTKVIYQMAPKTCGKKPLDHPTIEWSTVPACMRSLALWEVTWSKSVFFLDSVSLMLLHNVPSAYTNMKTFLFGRNILQ